MTSFAYFVSITLHAATGTLQESANSHILSEFLRDQKELPWQQNLSKRQSIMLNTVKRVLPRQLNLEKMALTVDTQRNIKILDSLRLRY